MNNQESGLRGPSRFYRSPRGQRAGALTLSAALLAACAPAATSPPDGTAPGYEATAAALAAPEQTPLQLFWRNTNGDNSQWFLPSTDLNQVTGTALPSVPAGDLTIEAAGDMNRDGFPDLLWRSASTGANGVWLSEGARVVGTAALPAAPDTAWHMAGAADFDGDGRTDILWHHATGLNGIWLMDKRLQLKSWVALATTDAAWKPVAVADLSGDGKPDILWRHDQTLEGALWVMNGTTSSRGVAVPALKDAGSTWRLVGAVDVTADRVPDLIWQNAAGGQLAYWQMGPASPGNTDTVAVVQGALFGPAVDASWKLAALAPPAVHRGDIGGDEEAVDRAQAERERTCISGWEDGYDQAYREAFVRGPNGKVPAYELPVGNDGPDFCPGFKTSSLDKLYQDARALAYERAKAEAGKRYDDDCVTTNTSDDPLCAWLAPSGRLITSCAVNGVTGSAAAGIVAQFLPKLAKKAVPLASQIEFFKDCLKGMSSELFVLYVENTLKELEGRKVSSVDQCVYFGFTGALAGTIGLLLEKGNVSLDASLGSKVVADFVKDCAKKGVDVLKGKTCWNKIEAGVLAGLAGASVTALASKSAQDLFTGAFHDGLKDAIKAAERQCDPNLPAELGGPVADPPPPFRPLSSEQRPGNRSSPNPVKLPLPTLGPCISGVGSSCFSLPAPYRPSNSGPPVSTTAPPETQLSCASNATDLPPESSAAGFFDTHYYDPTDCRYRACPSGAIVDPTGVTACACDYRKGNIIACKDAAGNVKACSANGAGNPINQCTCDVARGFASGGPASSGRCGCAAQRTYSDSTGRCEPDYQVCAIVYGYSGCNGYLDPAPGADAGTNPCTGGQNANEFINEGSCYLGYYRKICTTMPGNVPLKAPTLKAEAKANAQSQYYHVVEPDGSLFATLDDGRDPGHGTHAVNIKDWWAVRLTDGACLSP